MAPAPLVAASFGSPSDHLPAGPGLARPSPLCSPSGPPTSACLAPPQPPAALLTSLYSAPPSPRRRRLPPLRLRLRLQVCPPLPSATSAPPRSPPPAGSAPPSTFDSLRLRPPVPSSPSRLLRRIAAPASYPNPAASTSAAAPQAQKQQRRLRVLYTIPVWGSRRRWWCAACCSTACSWSPSCSPATSASYPSPPPPSSRPSPTSPASASCWEWEARWIHSVDNHMGQNNMMRSVVDSWSFRVRFTSVPYQVSASPKYCPPTGSWFWSDIDTPQSAVLVPGSWFRPWQQRRNWHGCSRQVLKDVNTYLRLAIPSTFMTCLEYWTFEMVVLLAGFLPNQKLETSILSISLNTMWMVYTFPSGLSSAISIRVSNESGAEVPGIRKQQEF